MSDVQSVTDATFADTVLLSDKPVLVDFWAEWCGPCRQIAPVLNEIATTYGDKITVVKMNVDEQPQTAAGYGVIGLPTVAVFNKGEMVKNLVGAKPKSIYLKELADFIG